MILAHRLASGPDPFSQILTGSSTLDPSWFCTIWSRPSLEEQNWIRCEKSDPAYTTWPNSGSTLATVAITGHNQNASKLDPACLLGKRHAHVSQGTRSKRLRKASGPAVTLDIRHVYWEKDMLMSAKEQDQRGWGKPLGQLWHLTVFSTQSPTTHHWHTQEAQVS